MHKMEIYSLSLYDVVQNLLGEHAITDETL
jgi:hypothetical protein